MDHDQAFIAETSHLSGCSEDDLSQLLVTSSHIAQQLASVLAWLACHLKAREDVYSMASLESEEKETQKTQSATFFKEVVEATAKDLFKLVDFYSSTLFPFEIVDLEMPEQNTFSRLNEEPKEVTPYLIEESQSKTAVKTQESQGTNLSYLPRGEDQLQSSPEGEELKDHLIWVLRTKLSMRQLMRLLNERLFVRRDTLTKKHAKAFSFSPIAYLKPEAITNHKTLKEDGVAGRITHVLVLGGFQVILRRESVAGQSSFDAQHSLFVFEMRTKQLLHSFYVAKNTLPLDLQGLVLTQMSDSTGTPTTVMHLLMVHQDLNNKRRVCLQYILLDTRKLKNILMSNAGFEGHPNYLRVRQSSTHFELLFYIGDMKLIYTKHLDSEVGWFKHLKERSVISQICSEKLALTRQIVDFQFDSSDLEAGSNFVALSKQSSNFYVTIGLHKKDSFTGAFKLEILRELDISDQLSEFHSAHLCSNLQQIVLAGVRTQSEASRELFFFTKAIQLDLKNYCKIESGSSQKEFCANLRNWVTPLDNKTKNLVISLGIGSDLDLLEAINFQKRKIRISGAALCSLLESCDHEPRQVWSVLYQVKGEPSIIHYKSSPTVNRLEHLNFEKTAFINYQSLGHQDTEELIAAVTLNACKYDFTAGDSLPDSPDRKRLYLATNKNRLSQLLLDLNL